MFKDSIYLFLLYNKNAHLFTILHKNSTSERYKASLPKPGQQIASPYEIVILGLPRALGHRILFYFVDLRHLKLNTSGS